MLFRSLELDLCSEFLFSWYFGRLDADRPHPTKTTHPYPKTRLSTMLQIVEGIDHSGPIELTQQPQNVSDRSQYRPEKIYQPQNAGKTQQVQHHH